MHTKVKGFLTSIKKNKYYVFLFFLCLIALIIRLKCCFWGFPIHTHPDEFATVDYTIEMLERHSWEAQIYNRPDHFEIKLDAVVFTIASWLVYKQPAYEAFKDHEMTFYLLARGMTSLFGVGIIPLLSYICWHLFSHLKCLYKRLIQVMSVILACFSYTLVQHSAYATPDVILTFIILLFSYFMLRYIENGRNVDSFGGLIAIGIGITIKYPAVILCIPFAIIVIYRKICIEKKARDIFKCVIYSIIAVLGTIFVVSPNLITNFEAVIDVFYFESGASFLGVDKLSIWGNLKFYLDFVFSEFGYVSEVPLLIGLFFIIKEHKCKYLVFLSGPIFLVCMSVFSVHWTRWMIPLIPFYVIIMSYGLIKTFEILRECAYLNCKWLRNLFYFVIFGFGGLLCINVFITSSALLKFSSIPDAISYADDFCNENKITQNNSIYDGMTSLAHTGSYRNINEFTFINDKIVPISNKGNTEYYVMCDLWKNLYFNDKERYTDEYKKYEAIDDNYNLIFHVEPDGNYGKSGNIFYNIFNSIEYLGKECTYTGYPISIYSFETEYFAIKSHDGKYLSPLHEELESYIYLADEIYYWTKYDNGDGTYTLISKESGYALGVKPSEERFALFIADDSELVKCTINDINNTSNIIFIYDQETLAEDGNRVRKEKYESKPNQMWSFIPLAQ